MKKIIASLLLLVSTIAWSKKNETDIPNEELLREKINYVVNALINIDEDSIIEIISKTEDIEVGVDQYLSASKIRADFNNKGRLHSYLFNSNKYNKLNQKYLTQFKNQKCSDIYMSISEVLAHAKKNRIKYELNPILLDGKVKFVRVNIEWDGKKAFPDNWRYVLVFAPINDQWYLMSLKIRD